MTPNSGKSNLLAAVTMLASIVFTAQFPNAAGQAEDDDTSEGVQELRATQTFDFGAFCIDNIPQGAVTSVGRPERHADGVWRAITLTLNSTQTSKAHIFFLSGVSRRAGLLSACGTGLPKDVTRILEGDLDSGSVTFKLLVRPFGGLATAEQIAPEGMDVVLTRVRSQFALLYGGQVSAKTLRVTNIGDFVANPQKLDTPDDDILEGTLKVGSQRLQILGAKIRLPGAPETITTNLSPGADGSAILVEIPTGKVSLFSGTQMSPPLTGAAATKLAAAGVTVDAQHWKLAHAVLTAYGGKKPPTLSFRDMNIDASHVVHQSSPYVDAKPNGPLSIAEASGALAPDSGEATAASYALRGVSVAKAALMFGGSDAAPAATGQGSVAVREISDDHLDGEIAVPSPDLPGLNQISPISGKSLTIHMVGEKTTPKTNGEMALTDAALGTLRLQGLGSDKLRFANTDAGANEFGLTFDISVPPQSGHWQFIDPTGAQIVLDGELKALAAKGTVWFGAGDKPPRLVVDPGTFHFAATGSVVRDSLLFGAPADHIQISPNLEVGSAAGFMIAKGGKASGSAELTAGLLVIDTPQISFDVQDQGRFRVNAPVRFDTGATVGWDLSSRDIALIRGHAEVVDTSATAVDSNQSVTLSGIEVRAPSIGLKYLAIVADNGVANIELKDLTFQASALTHAADPSWSATNAATSIHHLSASLAQVNKAIQLKDASIEELSVSADSGAYTSHDGFSISGQKMAVKIGNATKTSVANADISIATGNLALYSASSGATTSASAAYDTFHVTASGTSDDINGALHLHVTSLSGASEFPGLKDKCSDKLILRLGLNVGSFDIDGGVQHGDASGRAVVHDPRIRLRKTSNDTCEWNENYDVSVPRTVLASVCWIPLIGKAVCDNVSKVVNVNIRVPVRWRAQAVALDVGIKSDDVVIALAGKQGASVCVHGAKVDAAGKIQSLTVTPTFEAHGDLAELVKKAWDLAFQTSEGLLTTSVATSLTNAASLITDIFPVDRCT